jgi:transposase
VPRVDDRRVLSGIFRRLRSGASWADIPERNGPYTTCCDHFVLWRKAGVWDRLITRAHDGDIQMIDGSSVKANRRTSIPFSRWLHRHRNLVERFFNKLKHFRVIATQYKNIPKTTSLSRNSPLPLCGRRDRTREGDAAYPPAINRRGEMVFPQVGRSDDQRTHSARTDWTPLSP